MSTSPQALAVGSVVEPGTGIVLRSIFKSRPSGIVVEEFERHVRATGSPETFDRVSTSRPPPTGQLAVLAEFRAEKGKRPRGDFAPCPICNPNAPQFLHGLLIWCEETAAIYAIGMECGGTLDREGRLDRALTAYDRQQARRRFEDQLLTQLPCVPALRRWIAAQRTAAMSADRLSRGFRKKVPRVYSVVKHAFQRDGDLPVREAPGDQPRAEPIRLVGASFIKTTFGADDVLRRVDEMLAALDNGEDELECIEAIARMPEEEVARALKFLREANREVAKVFNHICDCAAFISSDNMARLANWSELPGSPFRLMAYAERGKVKIYAYKDRSDWGDTSEGLMEPEPPPTL